MTTTILPGFPDAATTGVSAGTTLTPYVGDLTITTPGAVISGLDITGTIYVEAPNVTIENCRVDANGGYFCINASVTGTNASGLTVANCTLLNSAPGAVAGSNIQCSGATIINNDMSGMQHNIQSDGGNLIKDNYMHDLNGPTASHFDNVYIGGGDAGDIVVHNTLVSFNTSNVIMKTDYGQVNNNVIDDNLMLQQDPIAVSGQHTASYNVYLVNNDAPGDATGNVITNNVMQEGYYGYDTVIGSTPIWSGNTDYSTGQTISVAGDLSATPPGPTAPAIDYIMSTSGVVVDHISNQSTVNLNGTAVANSTVKVFDGTTQVGTATANGNGEWTLTTSALADGTHNLTATETDSFGNTSVASPVYSVTIDTQGPAAPTMAVYSQAGSAVGSTTSLTDLVLQGTAEAGSTINVFDSGHQIGIATTNATGAWSYDTGTLATGTHSFTATATDAVGTSGASAAIVETVTGGSVPPPAGSIEFQNVSGSNHVFTITGTADANSTVQLYDGTTLLGTVTANASGTWSGSTGTLSDTLHAITAKEVDTSGNVITTSSGAAIIAGSQTATMTGTGGDDFLFSGSSQVNDTFVFASGFGHSTVAGFTASGSGHDTIQFNTSVFDSYASVLAHASQVGGDVLITSGQDTLTIKSTQLSALQSSDFQFVSSTPPAGPNPPVIASFSPDTGVVGDHITNVQALNLNGTADANSTVKVFDGTTQVGTATANGSGQWTITTSALADGTHNLTATETDSFGNTSAASGAFSVTIDTHVPVAPTLAVYSQAGSAVGSTTSLNDLVLKGTAEAGSTIDVFDSGHQIGTVTTNGSGAWSYDTGTLATGNHSFTATAIDVAGTASSASAAIAETVMPAPPTPTASIEFQNVSGSGHVFTITGTADANSTVKLYDGTTLLGTTTANASGIWSKSTGTLSDTLHAITAQEVDSSGNIVAKSSGAAIIAGSKTATMTGTGGDDFLFSGSSQVNDTFVFASGFGHSTIRGFTASGSGHDTIQFSTSVFDSYASVLAHASQAGGDVVITSGQDTLTLKSTHLTALQSADFHFA